jgi:hypothetical protein
MKKNKVEALILFSEVEDMVMLEMGLWVHKMAMQPGWGRPGGGGKACLPKSPEGEMEIPGFALSTVRTLVFRRFCRRNTLQRVWLMECDYFKAITRIFNMDSSPCCLWKIYSRLSYTNLILPFF